MSYWVVKKSQDVARAPVYRTRRGFRNWGWTYQFFDAHRYASKRSAVKAAEKYGGEVVELK